MAHRPYPNRERALRELDRHTVTVRQPSELQQRLAAQARIALDGMATAMRPITEGLVRAGAPRNAPLSQQMLVAIAPHYKAEVERSAPGVLVMAEMARQMRRTA